ncbi:MAG TPA: phosphatase PAP2 family protein [Thermomicrobiaceae bacterium]|nr:phosphatase PAP2 family protein [Thermomicrobiaceae bacterium]
MVFTPGLTFLWDPRAVAAVQRFFGPGWLGAFQALTYLGDIWVVVVALALARWLGGRRLAYSLLAVIVLGAAVSTVLKALVGLPRPHGAGIAIHEAVNDGSFPSGHSLTATTLWGGLARLGRLPWALAGLLVAIVMLSRVYLGVHYPGDVLGGAALGLLLVIGCTPILPGVSGRLASLSRRPAVVLGALLLAGALAAIPFVELSVRAWQVAGGIVGAAIGISLDVLASPSPQPPDGLVARVRLLLVGLGGLAALLGAAVLVARSAPPLSGVGFALAALWVVPLAPVVVARLEARAGAA